MMLPVSFLDPRLFRGLTFVAHKLVNRLPIILLKISFIASNHRCLLMPSIPYPRAFNHVGVGVADLDQAIKWYQEVFGFVLLRAPFEVRAADGSYSGEQAADVLGKSFLCMRQAHLTTANGAGFELFQLIDPPHERRA